MKLPWFKCSKGVLKLSNIDTKIKLHNGSLYIFDGEREEWQQLNCHEPLEYLRSFWKQNIQNKQKIMLGYFSYNFAGYLEQSLLDSRKQILDFPDFYFVVSNDYCFENRDSEFSPTNNKYESTYFEDSIEERLSKHSLISDEKYKELVVQAKELIRDGELYEINLSRPILFESLNKAHKENIQNELFLSELPNYAAYFPLSEEQAICSLSPECFLKKVGSSVSTFPIKGTRKRLDDEEQNQLMINELITSHKERAEHLMVVDLERNDLGKIAVPGSVKVKKHAELNSFSSIHHLISEINCEIKPNLDVFDLIKATFPSGSVTGAPKIRTMQAIKELEPFPRSAYTGSLGFIDSNGDCEFSILIRTCLLDSDKLLLNVGGGIVWDSDPEFENQETYIKALSVLKNLNYFNKDLKVVS